MRRQPSLVPVRSQDDSATLGTLDPFPSHVADTLAQTPPHVAAADASAHGGDAANLERLFHDLI